MGGTIHKISHLNLSEALNPPVPQTRTHMCARAHTQCLVVVQIGDAITSRSTEVFVGKK